MGPLWEDMYIKASKFYGAMKYVIFYCFLSFYESLQIQYAKILNLNLFNEVTWLTLDSLPKMIYSRENNKTSTVSIV